MKKQKHSIRYTTVQKFLMGLLSVIFIIPAAPYINRLLPPILIGAWNVDLILSILIAFAITRIIDLIFRPLIIPAVVLLCAYVLVLQFSGQYKISNIFKDYKAIVWGNWITRDTKQQDVLSFYPGMAVYYRDKTETGIRKKIDYKDSLVRNFSIKHSLQYFEDYYSKYGKIVRELSLFKYINANFKYVADPLRDEYFASPRETITNGLGGDCDDHAILMASCMEAIGAESRIVLVTGHAYPELYCGDKKQFEIMEQAIIRLFAGEKVKYIYYHENDGKYWINLDYTAHYPGGPYLNNDIYAVIENF